jgi:hypothetical protein
LSCWRLGGPRVSRATLFVSSTWAF